MSLRCVNQLQCGGKIRWPELVGTDPAKAVAIIKKENVEVDTVIIDDGSQVFLGFCCNRVIIFTGGSSKIIRIPQIG
ncbi:putative Proteinase inhibitor [Zostera marina]|uniref:Uncharacterized protein n=1 Tax=Zostera marina TaxID=29655 RepID=A0A0K9NXH2_ZOSMR|nr:putative Proteinase inhibitor [Zostera marina]KMZ73280.1 putative Proteinase inhibitor [Zostera marina]